MPRKILYVEGCRDGTVGGSHISLYSMVANLDRALYQPVVLFYDEHHIAEKMRALGADVRVLENRRPFDVRSMLARGSVGAPGWVGALLPLQRVANFVWFFLRPALRGAAFIRHNGIALVHLNNSSSGNHEWMLASLLARVPYVSHERGVGERLSRSSRWLGGAAATNICISSAIREALVRQGLSGAKAVVVYNGIDTERVRPTLAPERVKALHGIGPDDPVIGVVGNIKKWKGQETVVQATAILKERWPGIRCLLVGDATVDVGYHAYLCGLVERLDLRDNVIFAGFRNNPADYINAMDVVVHPSHQPEPFGRVNIEAMYLRKPVVSTNLGGPTEIFDNGSDGILIEPDDAPLLARHVAALVDSPELRRRLGENAHRSVMSRFTIAETIRGIERIYRAVLAS